MNLLIDPETSRQIRQAAFPATFIDEISPRDDEVASKTFGLQCGLIHGIVSLASQAFASGTLVADIKSYLMVSQSTVRKVTCREFDEPDDGAFAESISAAYQRGVEATVNYLRDLEDRRVRA